MINLNKTLSHIGLILIVGLLAVACGKQESGGSVDIQFSNATASAVEREFRAFSPQGMLSAMAPQSSYLGETPLIYQMKLVTIYLVEDIDPVTSDNRGAGTRIWTSKKCDADLTHCGIASNSAPYIVDYFNFAAGSAAVNQAFANYKRTTKEESINPGTYNYLRVDFTGKVIEGVNDQEPNLMFGSLEAHEVRAQQQAILVKLPTPLVLNKGESFTVDLAYNLENRLYEGIEGVGISSRPAEVTDSNLWTCDSQELGANCIVEAEFLPTVTKK